MIDREVASYMRDTGYDLRHYFQENWSRIGPEIVGKIRGEDRWRQTCDVWPAPPHWRVLSSWCWLLTPRARGVSGRNRRKAQTNGK